MGMPGICKGICSTLKVPFSPHNGGHYLLGHKRCTLCELFVACCGTRCPCCGSRLRAKPMHSEYRRKLLERTIPVIKSTWETFNQDLETFVETRMEASLGRQTEYSVSNLLHTNCHRARDSL